MNDTQTDANLFKRLQHQTNKKFKMDSFMYAPVEEFVIAQDVPGDSWIGVYFDSNWWGDMCNWRIRWANNSQSSGIPYGTFAKGVLPAYPEALEEGEGKLGVYPDIWSNADFAGSRGGGLMIELIEEG
jgi:hypothetical protein